jgi:hypothetical protein
MAASNRGRSAGRMRSWSVKRFTAARIRTWTISSAATRMGSTSRKRTWASMSLRKESPAVAPSAWPSLTERRRRGSQATMEMTTIRRNSISSAGPVRWARWKSW